MNIYYKVSDRKIKLIEKTLLFDALTLNQRTNSGNRASSRNWAKHQKSENLEKYKLIYNHIHLGTKGYDVRNGIIKENLYGKFAF